ncbi:GntR family transcriptional regulator [Microbacterium sp. 22242]|uniref:GntR family transcriptional regulator n=1 Tax=Microbacterium sp. 22242 TaxID=3453896 RepID=UPI003F8587F8
MPIPKGDDLPSRTLIRDRVYAQIKDAILDGTLRPGERLDDAELLEWLGVSRTPVRQALYVLTVEGLVETSPQSYTRVVMPKREDAMEYLRAIGVLVAGVMDLSLPAADPADIDRLIERIRHICDAVRREDLEATLAASDAYHSELLKLCRNVPMRRLVEQSGMSLAYYVVAVYRSLAVDWESVLAGYEKIIAALEHRRIEEAAAVTRSLFGVSGVGRPIVT